MAQLGNIDIQARSILDGLSLLETVLEEPVAREALDLAKNARTAENHDILQRLRRSLTQYLERDGDLFYVGLIGHFSSGKTSTINSLLGTWKTAQERKTDLHPTDTVITLITRSENLPSLLGVISAGQVPIIPEGVENPLLDNVVLADTPGTGDPHLVKAIARDFLPICDVVLFVFSAASPLDQTDMPLLLELHKRFPFIPIRFVVTRADELCFEGAVAVSPDTIDPQKRSRFLAEALSRINRLMQPSHYTEDHFILVDNKKHYNVDALANMIKVRCDPQNPKTKIEMHSHKLHYYLTVARELKSFFSSFLNDKLRELGRIVQRAEQNIQRYNENVRISNNHLTKNWIDQLTSLQVTKETLLKRLPKPDRVPSDIRALDAVAQDRSSAANRLVNDANRTATLVAPRFVQEVIGKLRNYLRDVEKSKSRIALEERPVSQYQIAAPIITLDIEYRLFPTTLAIDWRSSRQVEIDALLNAGKDLRRLVEDTSKFIQARSPLVECDLVVRAAQDSLSIDLSQFFRNVELYRDGVFAIQTKELISTLGIGAQLDALEAEFNDSDKAKFTAAAIERLFPEFDQISAAAITQLNNLEQKLGPVLTKIKELKTPQQEIASQFLTPTIEADRSGFLRAINSELQNDVGELCRRIELKLSGALVDARRLFGETMEVARKERRKRYGAIIVAAGLIGILTYLGYLYANQDVSQSIFSTVGWGLVSGFLGQGMGYVVAKLIDKFPQTSAKIREDFDAKFRVQIEELTENELGEFHFSALNESYLSEQLQQAYRGVLRAEAPDAWLERASNHLVELGEIQASYSVVWVEYVEAINRTINNISSYFNDATKNLELLNAVAAEIKERAIEPSFQLLANTRELLNEVKNRIDSTEFV